MGFKLLGINGSLTPPPSRTSSVLHVALAGARAYDPSVETEVLELLDFSLEFCDGRPPESYNNDTRRALALVEEADAYLVATPIYRGSYTGALKNFFDLVPNDPKGHDPLRGKVVSLLTTGGSDHHYIPDKFSTVAYGLGQLGVPLLDDALTRLECRLVTRHAGGDHSIFIGEVVSISTQSHSQPLLYFRSKYGRLHSNAPNLITTAVLSNIS